MLEIPGRLKLNIELINYLHKGTEIKDGHWFYREGGKTTKILKHLGKKVYKSIRLNGKYYLVHRLSLCIYLGLDYGDSTWMACHTCQWGTCWNPLHLYPGNNSTNMIDNVSSNRNVNKQKTHCKYGHPLSGDNLIIYHRNRSNNPRYKLALTQERLCKICYTGERNKRNKKTVTTGVENVR